VQNCGTFVDDPNGLIVKDYGRRKFASAYFLVIQTYGNHGVSYSAFYPASKERWRVSRFLFSYLSVFVCIFFFHFKVVSWPLYRTPLSPIGCPVLLKYPFGCFAFNSLALSLSLSLSLMPLRFQFLCSHCFTGALCELPSSDLYVIDRLITCLLASLSLSCTTTWALIPCTLRPAMNSMLSGDAIIIDGLCLVACIIWISCLLWEISSGAHMWPHKNISEIQV